jgi:hypothetical protein
MHVFATQLFITEQLMQFQELKAQRNNSGTFKFIRQVMLDYYVMAHAYAKEEN